MEVQPADPVARRRALLLVGCGFLVGTTIYLTGRLFSQDIEAWVLAGGPERLRIVFVAFAIAIWGPALAFAWYFWRLGGRIVRAQRFPPPGFRVARDTPVLTGGDATSRGRWVQVLAALVAVGALAMGVLLWRLFSLVGTART